MTLDAAEKAGAPVVRGLEWTQHPSHAIWRVDTMLGTYKVFAITDVIWTFDGFDGKADSGEAASAEDGFAICQADYEQRILSALNPGFLSELDTARKEVEKLTNEQIWEPAECSKNCDDPLCPYNHAPTTVREALNTALSVKDGLSSALTEAKARIAELEGALEPFAAFGRNNTDDEGWAGTQCQRERIVDWFGPSDFRAAIRALPTPPEPLT